jgi:hypothetical protein
MKIRLIAVLLFFIFSTIADAAEYYVDKDSLGGPSSNSNPGTLTQPWETIQKAIDTMKQDDITYVRAGTYDEKLNVSSTQNSGVAGHPITIRNYGNEIVNVIVSNPTHWDDMVLDVAQAFWVVEGLTFKYRIHISGDHFILKNCEVDCSNWGYFYPAGIVVNSADSVTIEECRIHDYVVPNQLNKDAHGIYGDDCINLTLRNNEMWNNQGDHIQMAPFSTWRDLTIEGNHFYAMPDPSLNGLYPGENAIDLKGNRPADSQPGAGGTVLIRDNIIHGFRGGVQFGSGFGTGTGSGGEAITMRGVDATIIIEDNQIYDCDNGIFCHANGISDVPGGTFPDVTIRRNVIFDLNTDTTDGTVHTPSVFYINIDWNSTYDINTLRIVHNIVANTASRLFNDNVRVQDGVIQNNIFHNIPVTVDSYRASVWGDFDHNLWNNVDMVVYSWETDPIIGPTDIIDMDPLIVVESMFGLINTISPCDSDGDGDIDGVDLVNIASIP